NLNTSPNRRTELSLVHVDRSLQPCLPCLELEPRSFKGWTTRLLAINSHQQEHYPPKRRNEWVFRSHETGTLIFKCLQQEAAILAVASKVFIWFVPASSLLLLEAIFDCFYPHACHHSYLSKIPCHSILLSKPLGARQIKPQAAATRQNQLVRSQWRLQHLSLTYIPPAQLQRSR
ncbi:unnamed protein product, partial [Ectocarpus sp. 12 AP-2014]